MTTITSDVVNVARPAQDIFAFLIDLNNLEKLMPEGKYSEWESTADDCRFNLNGMASIGMKITDSNPPNSIHIVSNGKNPFEFTLDVSIKEAAAGCDCQSGGNQCIGQLKFASKRQLCTIQAARAPLQIRSLSPPGRENACTAAQIWCWSGRWR